MYWLNFVVVIFASFLAIWQWRMNNFGYFLVDIVIVLINVPFAIKWVTNVIKWIADFFN